jgi:hypothetical protein
MVSTAVSIAQLQSEIDKCVVRCSNCHRRRTARQLAWIKSQRIARISMAQEAAAVREQLLFA